MSEVREMFIYSMRLLSTRRSEHIAPGFHIQILSHLKILNYILCCDAIIYTFGTSSSETHF